MRKKLSCVGALLTAVLLALMLAGCGAEPLPDDGRLRIVATNFPGYDLARGVAGEAAHVRMLLPPGTESHSYEPTPRDILAVQECDLFIYLGGESDAWVETILTSVDGGVNTLRMIDCVETLEEEHDHDHDHDGTPDHDAHDHGHGPGEVVEVDEHVWTSPVNAMLIQQAIAEELARLDAANAGVYGENLAAYQTELTEVDREIRDYVQTVAHPVMVFGDRFPLRYFAHEYGITCYSAFPGCSTQTEPSAATVAHLTDMVRREGLGTVYYIEFSNHLVADSIAEACGVGTALFHSCHNVSRQELEAGVTYLALMRQNLETLKATLK